jgi:hypothetical protein
MYVIFLRWSNFDTIKSTNTLIIAYYFIVYVKIITNVNKKSNTKMQNVPQKVVIIVGNIKNHYAKEY